MQLAKRAELAGSRAVRKHKRDFPSNFERIIKKQDKVIRYYSDEPCWLLGEAVEERLLNQKGGSSDRLIYLHKLDKNNWYCGYFESCLLRDELCGELSDISRQLGYEIERSHVWCTDEIDTICQEFSVVEPFVDLVEVENKFQLESSKKTFKWLLLWGSLLFLLALFVTNLNQPNEVKAQKTISATQKFLNDYENKVSASVVLDSGLRLINQLHFLPEGMATSSVRYRDGSIVSDFLQGEVRDKIKRLWLKEHPHISDYFNPLNHQFEFTLPTNSKWTAYNISDYMTEMLDGLQLLDVDIELISKRRYEQITEFEYRLSTSGHIGIIPFITEVIDAPFISASEMTLTQTGKMDIGLSMSIEISGIYKDD